MKQRLWVLEMNGGDGWEATQTVYYTRKEALFRIKLWKPSTVFRYRVRAYGPLR